MSAHHEDHHNENKPVSFTVPFLMACSLLIIIIMFLSLCDPSKGHHGECECKENCSKECMEACEKGDHSMHPAEAKTEAAVEEKSESIVVAADSAQSQAPAEVKAEAKAEEAHH